MSTCLFGTLEDKNNQTHTTLFLFMEMNCELHLVPAVSTSAVSTYADFGLCTHKFGNSTLVESLYIPSLEYLGYITLPLA